MKAAGDFCLLITLSDWRTTKLLASHNGGYWERHRAACQPLRHLPPPQPPAELVDGPGYRGDLRSPAYFRSGIDTPVAVRLRGHG